MPKEIADFVGFERNQVDARCALFAQRLNAVLDHVLADVLVAVVFVYADMVEIRATSVIAAQDAADDLVVVFGNRVGVGIALQKLAHALEGIVNIINIESLDALPQCKHRIVIFESHHAIVHRFSFRFGGVVGNRTPVRKSDHLNFYMLRHSLKLCRCP